MACKIKAQYAKSIKNLSKLTLKNTNNLVKKWSEDMNRRFSKKTSRWRKDTCNEAHCHSSSGNINQNHNEITPHTCQNGQNEQPRKQQMLMRMQRKGNPLALLVECQLVQPLWRTVWRFLKKKKKNRTTIQSSNCTIRYLPKGYKNTDSNGHIHPNAYSSI